MGIKKANEFFGHSIFIMGALKVILVVWAVIQMFTSASALLDGGTASSVFYSIFSVIVGITEFGLVICSIVMIFVNLKTQPKVALGYLWVVGAFILGMIFSGIFAIFVVFTICGMYMKAGNLILQGDFGKSKNYKEIEQKVKDTDWFYNDK